MTRTAQFKKLIYDYYKKAGRHDLPWRLTRDPYQILVSEVMLQQTQVPRVLKKYEEFLRAFPTVESLSKAPVAKLLKVWQGLGYNRRALNLQRAARIVVKDFNGKFPQTPEELESLPGIGQSTRGAIMAFAWNIPTVFIETNIRAIYLHVFFKDKQGISDKEILAAIYDSVDKKNPRDWYYALMDYGVHLKQTVSNPSRRSKHHTRQSAFKGSNREIRSKILRLVLEKNRTRQEIIEHLGKTRHDVEKNLEDLAEEGFIAKKSNVFSAAIT